MASAKTISDIFRQFDEAGSGVLARGIIMHVLVTIGLERAKADALLANFGAVGETVPYEALVEWVFSVSAEAKLDPMSYYATPNCDMVTSHRVFDAAHDAAIQPMYATMDEFREKHAGDEALLKQTRNRVLVCSRCRKPNAYTMTHCNGCGTSLEGIDESTNDNIFMGFIYGIARGRFPYAVSTRLETEDLLAFDDPLAISTAHLCVIPTSVFCPDIRFLFADPARGLKLVDDLMECGRKAMLQTYWSDEAFVKRYWCGEAPPKTLEEMQELAVLGYNFPPSMFQLHLQFQHGPLFPFHEVLLRKDSHYHHGRFYPQEYVRAALTLGDAVRMDIHDDTKMEDIVDRVKSLGIDYDEMHAAMIEKGKRLSDRFPIWKRDDFLHRVTDGKVFSNQTGELLADLDPVELQKKDNAAMKNYAKPKCSLYSFMKPPGTVRHFVEGA